MAQILGLLLHAVLNCVVIQMHLIFNNTTDLNLNIEDQVNSNIFK